MYKLKYKARNDIPQVYYLNTIKEVFTEMMFICAASSIADCLKVQKEYNIRFYVTKVNK